MCNLFLLLLCRRKLIMRVPQLLICLVFIRFLSVDGFFGPIFRGAGAAAGRAVASVADDAGRIAVSAADDAGRIAVSTADDAGKMVKVGGGVIIRESTNAIPFFIDLAKRSAKLPDDVMPLLNSMGHVEMNPVLQKLMGEGMSRFAKGAATEIADATFWTKVVKQLRTLKSLRSVDDVVRDSLHHLKQFEPEQLVEMQRLGYKTYDDILEAADDLFNVFPYDTAATMISRSYGEIARGIVHSTKERLSKLLVWARGSRADTLDKITDVVGHFEGLRKAKKLVTEAEEEVLKKASDPLATVDDTWSALDDYTRKSVTLEEMVVEGNERFFEGLTSVSGTAVAVQMPRTVAVINNAVASAASSVASAASAGVVAAGSAAPQMAAAAGGAIASAATAVGAAAVRHSKKLLIAGATAAGTAVGGGVAAGIAEALKDGKTSYENKSEKNKSEKNKSNRSGSGNIENIVNSTDNSDTASISLNKNDNFFLSKLVPDDDELDHNYGFIRVQDYSEEDEAIISPTTATSSPMGGSEEEGLPHAEAFTGNVATDILCLFGCVLIPIPDTTAAPSQEEMIREFARVLDEIAASQPQDEEVC